jgi:hypothetical protein
LTPVKNDVSSALFVTVAASKPKLQSVHKLDIPAVLGSAAVPKITDSSESTVFGGGGSGSAGAVTLPEENSWLCRVADSRAALSSLAANF